jgi:hypothetical protein
MTDVSTVPYLLERLKAGGESPGETLTRVLQDAVALKVLEEAMVDRAPSGISISVSGNGESWVVYGEPVEYRLGKVSTSLGLALRSAAEAVEKGEV